MKQLIVFLVIVLGASACFGQSKKENDIFKAEEIRFEAMMEKDTVMLKKLLEDDCTYTHSNGLVESKRDHLNHISGGKIVYQRMNPRDRRIRFYGRKNAIVNGRVEVTGSYEGTIFTLDLTYTEVFIKKKGRWKLAAWHSVRSM